MNTAETNHQNFYGVVQKTPIQPIDNIGDANMFIKDETVQSVGSFKIRGALYKTLTVQRSSPELLQQGLITASAGNHAQGVALSAAYINSYAKIFLPKATAPAKVAAIQNLGATIQFVEGAVDDALDVAEKAAAQTGSLFIHPFDDPEVIKGQGTIGTEISTDDRLFESVFVPVGGGGLLAGVSQSLHSSPNTKVFGVQLEGCDSFTRSVAAKKVVELCNVNDLADGTAVKRAGEITLRSILASSNFKSMITVTNKELGCALVELEILSGIQAETAGGLAFAGMRKYLNTLINKQGNHLALVTGRHRDTRRFQKLVEA